MSALCLTLAYLLRVNDPVVVDRLYPTVAVVETTDGTVVDIPRCALPADGVEGGIYYLRACPEQGACAASED